MKLTLCALLLASSALAADPPASLISKLLDGQITMLDHEVVPLAEAIPADKFSFKPTQGEFAKSRTFAQQVGHLAAVIYVCSASILGEKSPVEMGDGENGPASLKTKDDYVKFLKDSLAYAHKAAKSVTDANATELVQSPFGDGKTPRLNPGTIIAWHTMDHYGQMAIYARLMGIVPPASR
jgi:uncharacterized damage-inducible protein DinB